MLQGYLHVSSLVFIILLFFSFFLVVLGTIHNLTKIVFLDWSVIRAHMSIWEAVRVEGWSTRRFLDDSGVFGWAKRLRFPSAEGIHVVA